ncbi:hypothetical protein V2G26_015397 [Clonostachys chloroleuca]
MDVACSSPVVGLTILITTLALLPHSSVPSNVLSTKFSQGKYGTAFEHISPKAIGCQAYHPRQLTQRRKPRDNRLIFANKSVQLEQHECLGMDDGTSNSQANNPAWPVILKYRANGSAGATPEQILPVRQCGCTEVQISLSATPGIPNVRTSLTRSYCY